MLVPRDSIKSLGGVLAGLLFLLSVWPVCTAGASGEAERSFLMTGIVYPIHDLSLSMAVDGAVAKIYAKEGYKVDADAPLITLKNDLQGLEVERRKGILDDVSQLETTRTNLALLKELVGTKEELFESTKMVSQSELKRNQIQLNQAEGEYTALQEREIKESIEYQIAEQMLANYTLTTPIQGVVTEVVPSPGEWVRAGDPIIRIIDSSECYLDLNLDAAATARLRSGEWNVEVNVETAEGPVNKSGRVGFIAPVADSGSGLIRIKVYFDNTSTPKAIPGFTGRLIILEESGQP